VNKQYPVQPTELECTPQYKKKETHMNVGLLKHGWPVTASWRLKNMCKVSTLSFHAGIAGDRLRGPYFLPPHLTEAVYQDFLRDVLPELLGDMDLQTRIHL
jgi:hypothetical protein